VDINFDSDLDFQHSIFNEVHIIDLVSDDLEYLHKHDVDVDDDFFNFHVRYVRILCAGIR